MNVSAPRVALGALILLNVGLGAFAVQLAAGKVPIPEAWAWVVPILQAVVIATTALLPRAGSESIAAQVDTLKAQGVAKRDMVVLSQDEAVPILAGALSPSQVAQVADEIEARLRQTPADTANVPDHIIGLIDRDEQHEAPPDPLPPNPRYPSPPAERG